MNFETIFYSLITSTFADLYKRSGKIDVKYLLKSLDLKKSELNKFLKLRIVEIKDIEVSNKEELENELALSLLVVLDILIKKLELTIDSKINPRKTIRETILEDNSVFNVVEVLFGTLLTKNYN